MNKPSLCGFASLEHFKKHTTYLVEEGCLHLLKQAADEMAAKYSAIWLEQEPDEAWTKWMDEMEAQWLAEQDQTRGV
jgi:hypothetical protein